MKIATQTKDGVNDSEVLAVITKHLDVEIVKSKPEYVFTFGGDGTFLDAVNHYGKEPIYIPINMGTLGFYCSWSIDKFDEVIKDLSANNLIYAPTLDIKVFNNSKILTTYNCLNEATLINPINTQILNILIDDFEIEKFRGTGVCISTPTGSTAYNKSLGGAIISSQKKLFQLTHIAAINNVKYRNIGNSIILDDNEKISFVTHQKNFANSILSVDRLNYEMKEVDKIEITFSQIRVKLLVSSDNNFYRRVHNAFIDEKSTK